MKVTGRVQWVGSGRPVKDAQVYIHPEDTFQSDKTGTTGEDGRFTIDAAQMSEFDVTIKHLDGRQTNPKRIEIKPAPAPEPGDDTAGSAGQVGQPDTQAESDKEQPKDIGTFEIASYEATIDQKTGTTLLACLGTLLIVLMFFWIKSVSGAENRGDAGALLYEVERARATAEDVSKLAGGDDAEALKKSLERLGGHYAAIEGRLPARDVSVIDNTTRETLAGEVAKLRKAIDGLTKPTAESADKLVASAEAVNEKIVGNIEALARGDLKRGTGAFEGMNWMVGSNVTLTVLFWALIGTLVRLVMTIQYYLYKSAFYRQGLYQHGTLLVAVPVLTLAMVKLLSLIRLSAEGDGQVIVLDFSDPQAMAIAAFLLALTPWGLWQRLLSISTRVGSR